VPRGNEILSKRKRARSFWPSEQLQSSRKIVQVCTEALQGVQRCRTLTGSYSKDIIELRRVKLSQVHKLRRKSMECQEGTTSLQERQRVETLINFWKVPKLRRDSSFAHRIYAKSARG
jgi:hypothetical protein